MESVEFVPVPVCGFALKEYNAAGKTALRVQKDLTEAVEGIDAEGKVVLLKVAGEMSAGKTSDIDFQQLKKTLKERGPSRSYRTTTGSHRRSTPQSRWPARTSAR